MNPIDRLPADKCRHALGCVIAYAGLLWALTAVTWLGDINAPHWAFIAAAAVLTILLQVWWEFVYQARQPGRKARDWSDVGAGAVGVALGVACSIA